ncbi:MAG TPA: NAD(P)H-dependent glycerol-3-phosphate dehydrogenase [Chthoniobacterales bacterium]|nr:NAD(P)H-dependent glycerol-3-phosphate dehydrogenase [Chthoniobacterales bacterium]
MKTRRIAVLGAGAWGTALSTMWAKRAHNIVLWGRSGSRIEELRRSANFQGSFAPTNDLQDCTGADLIVFVTRSTALRETAAALRKIEINSEAVLLSCIKGIERGTGKRMSEILAEIFPKHAIAVLSGPNLAAEISQGLPTATVLAFAEPDRAIELQSYLGTRRFRVYTSSDLAGTELGGALKNVFAIAAGAGDGLGLGDNSKAALVTRALAEMVRLGTKMGGELRTFYGLSGAGDLIATCFSQQSRNRRTGEQLVTGRSLEEIASSVGTVAEGIPTAKSARECARKLGVETPIIDQVYALLYGGKSPARAMEELLQREQKAETI